MDGLSGAHRAKEPGKLSLESVSDTSVPHDMDQPVNKTLNKLYRKLDARIIPALWCLYFLSSFGAAAYGNAITMNFEKNHSIPLYLNLTSQHLSTASALDYVGYIIFDLPMNLIMTVVSPQSWMARIIITIGTTYSCYAAVKNSAGVIAIRFFTGVATAGVWPGMTYYISMWYPAHRTARRIGYYFTASQISTAAAGLIAAGFSKMDGARGYTGYQWMFLVYGVVTTAVGFALFWWLPDRPESIQKSTTSKIGKLFVRLMPSTPSPLNGQEEKLHAWDMREKYSRKQVWSWRDLRNVLMDPRIWPLVIMYFGVVGTGIGIMVFATTIIQINNPRLSSLNLSLLSAPIWLFDFAAILLVTPLSDRFKGHRGLVFSLATTVIMAGLFITSYAKGSWSRWGGLLICGFGLGPTVPICMTWAAEIFHARHGDLGAAASSALVSGLGNLGSVTTTYALYTGWPADKDRQYLYSNMVMVAILGASIISAGMCTILRWYLGDFGEQGLMDVTFLKIFRHRRQVG